MDGLPDAAPPAPTPQQQPKRDEWSESGISRLLEAYEAKWLLRNRAKLKWSDWVDIAHDVSAHCSSAEHASKPGAAAGGTAKTPNQCKNKVESMKKRYRAESAAATRAGSAGAASASGGPSWRFFGRMDGLLKGPAAGCSGQAALAEPGKGGIVQPRAPLKAEPEVDAEADTALQQSPDTVEPPGALSELLNAEPFASAFMPPPPPLHFSPPPPLEAPARGRRRRSSLSSHDASPSSISRRRGCGRAAAKREAAAGVGGR